MNPLLMRRLWSEIEAIPTTNLCSLDDRTLVDKLMKVMGQKQALNSQEKQEIDRYLRAKLSLVRDLADARLDDPCLCDLKTI